MALPPVWLPPAVGPVLSPGGRRSPRGVSGLRRGRRGAPAERPQLLRDRALRAPQGRRTRHACSQRHPCSPPRRAPESPRGRQSTRTRGGSDPHPPEILRAPLRDSPRSLARCSGPGSAGPRCPRVRPGGILPGPSGELSRRHRLCSCAQERPGHTGPPCPVPAFTGCGWPGCPFS